MLINGKRKLVVILTVLVLSFTNLLTTGAQSAAAAVSIPIKSCLTPFAQYSAAKHLTPKQLVRVLQWAGFKGSSLKIAWAVAMKETHGNPIAHNFSRYTQDDSYGVFQINLYGTLKGRIKEFNLKSARQLTNPIKNAQIAFYMSSGGKNWTAWHSNPGERDHWIVQQWVKHYPQMA